jgi:hypothetical protein
MHTAEQSARRDQWRAIVEKQETSGLSQTEYCKQNNLVISQFTYYRGLIRASERTVSTKLNVFSPVKINKTEQNTSSDIRILLPNGFQCFIPTPTDVSHVKRLIEVLLSC